MMRQQSAAIIVCLACAASVAGHWWIARGAARQHLGAFDFTPPNVGDRPFALDSPFPDWIEPHHEPAAPRLLAHAAFEAAAIDADAPADALHTAGAEQSPPREGASSPVSRRRQQELDSVRAVIDEEMPEASAEERDIWFDELKSLPAEVVRDLLQVRQQMRVLTPDHTIAGPSQLPPPASPRPLATPPEVAAERVTQSRRTFSSDWSATRQALEQAIAWSTHNLSNAATAGYKRVDVVLGDAYAFDDAGECSADGSPCTGRGCRVAALRLDMSPGELRETGRAFDVTIDGAGLFVVRADGASLDWYTRGGGWILDDQRRLGILRGDETLLLQPVVVLPEDAVSMQISSDGVIAVRTADAADSQAIGQIHLAIFTDPTRLAPIGNGIYSAPLGLSPRAAVPGSPTVGVIRQGFLELSNVDVQREESDRDAWESVLRSLPPVEFHRTARGLGRTAN